VAKDKTKRSRRETRVGEAVARASLFPDESVVMTVRPARGAMILKYLATVGLYGLWRKRNTTTITDQRVLFGRGVFFRTERSVPLSHVEDAVFMRRGVYAYAEVAVNGLGRIKTLVGPMSPRSTRRFVSEILRRI
jgi:hypothetical protein